MIHSETLIHSEMRPDYVHCRVTQRLHLLCLKLKVYEIIVMLQDSQLKLMIAMHAFSVDYTAN